MLSSGPAVRARDHSCTLTAALVFCRTVDEDVLNLHLDSRVDQVVEEGVGKVVVSSRDS
jgi:hypothetical protein